MRQFLPFLDWLPKYNKNLFGKDLVAGITVGIILIPQGMAYAMIAGLPPVYGGIGDLGHIRSAKLHFNGLVPVFYGRGISIDIWVFSHGLSGKFYVKAGN